MPSSVFQDYPEGPELVVISSGEFMMGSPDSKAKRDHDEGPVHRAKIPAAFAVGKYEVTFDGWNASVSAGECSQKPEDEGWPCLRRPLMDVNWDDA